jgi:hypothetical protein
MALKLRQVKRLLHRTSEREYQPVEQLQRVDVEDILPAAAGV